jgi:hypothetical protein
MGAESDNDVASDQLIIPGPRGTAVLIRTLLLYALLILFMGFFCKAAIGNFIDYRHSSKVTLLCSAVWLLLAGFMLIEPIHEVGLRQLLINVLGSLSQDHFARLAEPHEERKWLIFGFRLLGKTFHFLVIETSGIKKIDWSTGQATALAGRDMNDWQVTIWFRNDSICEGRTWDISFDRDETTLYLIGPSGPRSETNIFGQQFLDLCRRAGLEFESAESQTLFKVRRPCPNHDNV